MIRIVVDTIFVVSGTLVGLQASIKLSAHRLKAGGFAWRLKVAGRG